MFEFTEEDLEQFHPIEAAAIRVMQATDSRGLKIMLCDPINPESVVAALIRETGKLHSLNRFLHFGGEEQDQIACRLKVLEHVDLLSALLRAHLQDRGNRTPKVA